LTPPLMGDCGITNGWVATPLSRIIPVQPCEPCSVYLLN